MAEIEFEGPAPSGKWARWKQVAIFVLAPSLILGFFTIAPKLYEIFTNPNTSLSYVITSGPLTDAQGGTRQIYAIKIENNGSSSLTDVSAEVIEPNGQIESASLEKGSTDATGVILGEKYTLKIGQMLPTESVSLSLMTLSKSKNSALAVRIRSHETLGHLAKNADGEDKGLSGSIRSSIIYLVPAAIALTVFQIFLIRAPRSVVERRRQIGCGKLCSKM